MREREREREREKTIRVVVASHCVSFLVSRSHTQMVNKMLSYYYIFRFLKIAYQRSIIHEILSVFSKDGRFPSNRLFLMNNESIEFLKHFLQFLFYDYILFILKKR